MKTKLLSAPYLVWMALFTIIPLGVVLYYALTDSITGAFTLANLANIGNYIPIFCALSGMPLWPLSSVC